MFGCFSQATRSKSRVFGKKKEKCREKRTSDGSIQMKCRSECSEATVTERCPVFGVLLVTSATNNRSHDGVLVPVVVRQCFDYIAEHGLNEPDIYSIRVSDSRLDELQKIADTNGDILVNNVHEAVGLLGRFLVQLPDHVLGTNRLRECFERAADECPCSLAFCCTCLTGDRLKACLRQLPPCNYSLLAYLFRQLQQILATQHRTNQVNILIIDNNLQMTLKMSAKLLRIFILNASSKYTTNLAHSKAATFLFDDVEIKRYISPQRPDRLTDNLPTSRQDLQDELAKQQSRLQELHEQVTAQRSRMDVAAKEQQLWDVQMVVTQLKRKLKSMNNEYDSEPDHRLGPTLEMFEEKQLLAVNMHLRAQIDDEKRLIAQLYRNYIGITSSEIDDQEDEYWRSEWIREEQRREYLCTQLVKERRLCARLRACSELKSAVSKPTIV